MLAISVKVGQKFKLQTEGNVYLRIGVDRGFIYEVLGDGNTGRLRCFADGGMEEGFLVLDMTNNLLTVMDEYYEVEVLP